MPAVWAADPVTYTFTGNVSATGVNRQVFTFEVQGPARVDASVLAATATQTNLDVQIMSSRSQIVATSSSTTANPDTATYTFTGNSKGTWKLGVVARRGVSDFTATVTVTPTSAATSTTLDASTTTITIDPTSTTTTDTTTPGSTTTTSSTIPPTPSPHTPSHAPEFMLENHPVDEKVAVDEARRFNFISASRAMFKPYVRKMKEVNPNLTLLVYLIGTHLRDVEIEGIPDAWFAKDANSHRITSPYGFYLMDPSNTEWISYVRTRCVEWLAYSGYDGCFLDTMGIAPTLPGYESALPINKATGKPWTAPEWLKATTFISDNTRKAITPKPLLIQGTAQGDRYYNPSSPTSQLLTGSDGSMIEMFLRTPEASPTKFPTETRWKQDVNMVADHGTRGKYVLGVTKLWSHASTEQYEQWHEYSLGSFLLGFNGRGGFVFLRSKNILDNTQIVAQIGSPTAAYSRNSAGYYERNFANGKVFVNPTTSSKTISLGGSYKTLKGATVTSINLGANRGAILVKA